MTPAWAASEVPPAADLTDRPKVSPLALLPSGSELQNVMLPRYDDRHRLTGVLKARSMILVNDKTFAGNDVTVEFFNPDQSPRGRLELDQAEFNQASGFLRAAKPVTLHSDRIHTHGEGLCYAFAQARGFLIGPVISWIQAPTAAATRMKRPTSSRRPASAAIGLSLLSLPVAATPPNPVSPQEAAALHAEVAKPTPGTNAARDAGEQLTKDRADAQAASKAAAEMAAQAGVRDASAPEPTPPPQAPLDIKPGPADTVITCDGGMYFDADEGQIVYLKNVKVSDPRFELSGADKLQIFLAKKPAAAAKDPAAPAKDPAAPAKDPAAPAKDPAAPAKDPAKSKKSPADATQGLGKKFGDVDRIIANGAVRLRQKQVEAGKEPIEASGAIFTYHVGSGQIILSGGYPWVKQGSTFLRAEEPNLNLRILKSGSFVTEGRWIMGGRLEQKPK